MFGKLPDAEWFEELDPILKIYMYEHWCRDREEAYELAKSQSILVGSFTNPQAAKDMLKNEEPDFASTDEDFEKSMEMVRQGHVTGELPPEKPLHRRKRRKVITK